MRGGYKPLPGARPGMECDLEIYTDSSQTIIEVPHRLHIEYKLSPCSAAAPKKPRFCNIIVRTCTPGPWNALAYWLYRGSLCHLTVYTGLAMH